MDLFERPERLVVARLPHDEPWPEPPADSSFYSATRIDDEISVVCSEASAPDGARVEPGWRALSVAGPLDFSHIGVLAPLAVQLADAGISVFVLSTFDTDHVLVRTGDFDRSVSVLRSGGHIVRTE
jgi:uncharacterized protein